MKKHTLFSGLLILILLSAVATGRTITVKADGTGDYPTIQAAIDAVVNGDEVVCTPGTYTGNGNRDIDFKGKAITLRSSDPNNPSIVSATVIDCQGSSSNTCRGFYFHNGEDTNSVLDGFTITHGYVIYGGAIRCYESSPTIRNCTVIGNLAESYGGGIYCGRSSAVITNCIITANNSRWGGGINCEYHSIVTINNCIISANNSMIGGGVSCYFGANIIINNSIITANHAVSGGGINRTGGAGQQSDVTVNSCTICCNEAAVGGGIYSKHAGTSTISNCILYYNKPSSQIYLYGGSTLLVEYSSIQGGYIGRGNISADPCFVNLTGGNYNLSANSPCINTGDPNYVPAPNETDLDGLPRIIDGRIDMGAYEFNPIPVACIAGGDQIVEADSNCEARVVLDGSCSSDEESTPGTNDDINDFDWYQIIDPCDPNGALLLGTGEIIECNLPLGVHNITLVVTDKAGASDSNEIVITVEDITSPVFSLSVEPNVLWPVNHNMIEITPLWLVSDNCDEDVEVSLVGITVEDAGDTGDDILVDPNDGSIRLRAERNGKSSGRIYTITYQAVDDSNNIATGSAMVTVPHDQR